MRVNQYRVLMDDDRRPVLVKEAGRNYPAEKNLNQGLKIYRLFVEMYQADRLPEEHAWILALDVKYHLIGIFEISHGTCDMTCVNPREIFMRLCLIGAYGFVVVHNHPTGNVELSNADISVAETLSSAGILMGIRLIDSIIIGDHGYLSMRERGYLSNM